MTLFRTAAILGTTCLLLCACASAESLPTPDSLLGPRVMEMLQVGYARGPKALSETQRQYESLRKDAANDPRIDYAHGLVMLRLMRNKEAQDEFSAAIKHQGALYLPAWEALIWTQFIGKNYEGGYQRLLEFTKLVHESTQLSSDDRDDSFHWIGRVMAALELTVDSSQGRTNWQRTEKRLTELLGEDALDNYNRGKEDVYTRHSSLEDDIRQTREKAKKQQADQLEKKQSRIKKSLDDVKDKRESLKKSAEEMKEMLNEQTAAYQKEMTRLEKDYSFMERRSAVLISSMLALDQEVAILQQRRRNSNNNNANQNGIDQVISQIQNQRLVYGAEFQRTVVAADQIAANAQRLNQERAELVDQYQKATGQLVEEDAGAEKWKERTLVQAKALKKAEAMAKPPVPAAKIQAAKTFRTYVDLDLYAERNKVITSFGLDPVAK